MRILLVGEYSRFHNSLKEGLEVLGHEVLLVGTGDAFKAYPVDINVSPKKIAGNWLGRRIKNLIYNLSKVDISQLETGYIFNRHSQKFKGFDVVQLINSYSIRATIRQEKNAIQFLEQHNEKLFLSACGTDVPFAQGMLDDPYDYNLLDPYKKNPDLKRNYKGTLKYLSKPHKELFEFVRSKVLAIIPADVDYLWGLHNYPKATSLIPMPINTDILEFKPLVVKDRIIIFHGINRMNYIKKGNNFFEEACTIIKERYPDKVELVIAENMPYSQYIKAYDRAHILLDQATSLDQGYNAREAMAKGKVVFTGAEKEFINHYKLKETVAINAKPDTSYLVEQLENLILNPDRIPEIGRNARAFIEREHNYIKIAQQYLDIWNSYPKQD